MDNEEKKSQEETEETLKTDRDDALGYTREQIDIASEKPAAKKGKLKLKKPRVKKYVK